MKICWDNLENVYITKMGNFCRDGRTLYEKVCKSCKEIYLGESKSKACSYKCSNWKHGLEKENKKQYTEKWFERNPNYQKEWAKNNPDKTSASKRKYNKKKSI